MRRVGEGTFEILSRDIVREKPKWGTISRKLKKELEKSPITICKRLFTIYNPTLIFFNII